MRCRNFFEDVTDRFLVDDDQSGVGFRADVDDERIVCVDLSDFAYDAADGHKFRADAKTVHHILLFFLTFLLRNDRKNDHKHENDADDDVHNPTVIAFGRSVCCENQRI